MFFASFMRKNAVHGVMLFYYKMYIERRHKTLNISVIFELLDKLNSNKKTLVI